MQRPRPSRPRGARSPPPAAMPQTIDLIIVATSTPDMVFPSAACMVQDKLGMHGCAAFDVQAVCSRLRLRADGGRRDDQAPAAATKALVIGAEVFSRILDFKDRTTCVLFGDGAGAVVLEASDDTGHPGLRAARRRHATSASSACRARSRRRGARRPVPADGRAGGVQARGRACSRASARAVLAKAGQSDADIDWLIPHQANIRIMQSTAKKLKLAAATS